MNLTTIFAIISLSSLFISQWIKAYLSETEESKTLTYWYELSNTIFTLMFILTLIFYFIEPYIISSDKLLIEDSKVITI